MGMAWCYNPHFLTVRDVILFLPEIRYGTVVFTECSMTRSLPHLRSIIWTDSLIAAVHKSQMHTEKDTYPNSRRLQPSSQQIIYRRWNQFSACHWSSRGVEAHS